MTCINRIRALLVCSSLTLLSSCANYQVTLNERTLYQPPPLFQDYDVADDGLRECIAQHIRDEKITKAEQLRRLVCSYADIASLDGVEIFNELRQVNVAHNKLVNLAPLAGLTKLEQLSAKDNQLTDISAISGLKQLNHVDLSENPPLSCQHLDAALKNLPSEATILTPEQCAK